MVRVLMARGADPELKNKYVAMRAHTAHVCHGDRHAFAGGMKQRLM